MDLYIRHILQIRRSMDQSCVKVEVAVLGSPSLIVSHHGLCGRKATFEKEVHGLRAPAEAV